MELTPIGEAILPSVRTMLDMVDRQMMQAAATAQSRAGNITVGFLPGLFLGPLRSGIADFIIESPQVRLRFVEASLGELHRQLNERAIDLMIVELVPHLETVTLVQERLWTERLLVALPSKHVLASKCALDWRDVAELPIIIHNSHFEPVAYRTLLDRIDRQVQLEQHDVSCTTLLDMVGLGMGATIVFASGAIAHDGIVFRPIGEDDAVVGVDAVWPKDDRNPLRHHLLGLIRTHTGDVDTATQPPKGPARDRG